MKYSNKQIENILKDKFIFLIADYNFSLESENLSDWGFKIVYKNQTTAVSVIFEFREAYVNIILHKLVKGEIDNDDYPYKANIPLNNIGLDFIVKYKNSSELTKPLYDSTSEYYRKDNAFEVMVSNLAKNLKEFASNVLNGDFSIFNEVDRFVKEHYKRREPFAKIK